MFIEIIENVICAFKIWVDLLPLAGDSQPQFKHHLVFRVRGDRRINPAHLVHRAIDSVIVPAESRSDLFESVRSLRRK